MKVDYDHSLDNWEVESSQTVLSFLFQSALPTSLLDVGCGPGTWLRAATDLGVSNVLGLDGVSLPDDRLFVPASVVRQQDFTSDWDLGQQFDIALCLEVAEHLDVKWAARLVKNLTSHANRILFSAASPGQPGYHHVNCQWPSYWQGLFNNEGFVCDDSIRWQFWQNDEVRPWYRQNMFVAHRQESGAGAEKRLLPVIHPEILALMTKEQSADAAFVEKATIENGSLPLGWYLMLPFQVVSAKLRRFFNRSV